ncbi:hypothetical protein GCM10007148_02300 [Parvularcula lutaonensis]|nr:VOC family protein [Parvularcula lutaonensis]GGY37564.1 hypothetical protein GCM10007148_02300 [Parvularcula lutaonensis]
MYAKSILVDDQARALAFYTEKLRFQVKHDIPMGAFRWLALVSPEEPDGVELLLEPNQHLAGRAFQKALKADGIPWTAFSVDDIEAEAERLEAEGVTFAQAPVKVGEAIMATFDDTCGNLIQIIQLAR